MINFNGVNQKPYINTQSPVYHPNPKPDNDIKTHFNSADIVNNTKDVSNIPGRFLNSRHISENGVSSSSGLVTPPILSSSGDHQHALPENIGALITCRLNTDDRVNEDTITSEMPLTSFVTNGDEHPPPEFPPQFGFSQLAHINEDILKPASPLHNELATLMPVTSLHLRNSPDRSVDRDTPSTVSPASLPVLQPTTFFKQETESSFSAYDDAEYVAAALAAVDSVVCALVGDKAPCTTTAYDPALVGTGIDRLYSLSLAPVRKTGSVVTIATSTAMTATPAANAKISVCSHSLLLSSTALASSEGFESLTCPACGAVVPMEQLMLRQRIVAEAKHICDNCGKSFVRDDKLKRHIMSIHTMEKPHVCQICTKAFSRKDKLKDHLRHHDKAARAFECSQCLSSFVQKSDLNRHVRGVHQGEPGVGINMTVHRRMPGMIPITRPSRRKISPADSTLVFVPTISETATTVSTTVSNPDDAALALKQLKSSSSAVDSTVTTTVATATPAVESAYIFQQVQQQQQQAYPQHQLLASMVLPYYHTPAGHQFVAAALSAQKTAAEQLQQQQQQAFQQAQQLPPSTPSMMLLTRIAAHASNQAAPALTVTSTVSQQCEAITNSSTTRVDQQQILAQQPQYHHPHLAYHQHLLHQQAVQLHAHHYAAADFNYYQQQQLAAQQRVYQQAQGFLLAATVAGSSNGAVGSGSIRGSLSDTAFPQPTIAIGAKEDAVKGTGLILSAAAAAATDPTAVQQLAQLAATARVQQAVAAGGGFQVMENVISGQPHNQAIATQQTMATATASQHMGNHPTAFYAAYQHPYQATLQQQTQQQQQHQTQQTQQHYHQQAQHQLMLHHANAAYRPVVMTAAAAAAAVAVTTSTQNAIVVQGTGNGNGYQQQLAAFCQQQQQQQQRQGLVLAYQHHQQQTIPAATSIEQQR